MTEERTLTVQLKHCRPDVHYAFWHPGRTYRLITSVAYTDNEIFGFDLINAELMFELVEESPSTLAANTEPR